MPWARLLRCGRTIRRASFASLRQRAKDAAQARRLSGDRGGARRGLTGRGGQDRRYGPSDAAGLGDPVQRAGSGRAHQHSFTGCAGQARRYAQGLSRPDRGGGPDSGSPRRGALAGLRSDHAITRGVRALGLGRHGLSRLEGPGLLACERQAEGLQAGRRTPWMRSKKLCRPRGGNPRGTHAGHTGRGVVPGRDAGRPEEQTHLSLGQERLTSPRQPRSTHAIDLSVRRGVPANAEPAPPSCCRPATPKPCSFISTRSPPRSPLAPTPFSSSIKPAGMARKTSRFPSNISLLPLPPRRPNSTAKKTSGSSCGRIGCQTASLNLSTTSSITAAYAWNTLIDQPWKIMSIARRDWASRRSLHCEGWYKPILGRRN